MQNQNTLKLVQSHHSLKAKIEAQLDKLVKEGVIEPVQHAEWAAPIVPIIKSDNTVHICGDFKVTINAVSKLDRCPIPKIEDFLATLSGGKLHQIRLKTSISTIAIGRGE